VPAVATAALEVLRIRVPAQASVLQGKYGTFMAARLTFVVGVALVVFSAIEAAQSSSQGSDRVNEVLEWNQIFIDTLIATNTPNSSSQRLGATVHTAIFDAYNGIEQRYTPIFFVHNTAAHGASRRAAVIAAAYTALVRPVPVSTAAMLATLSERCENGRDAVDRGRSCNSRIEQGVAWGTDVAQAVLAWRAADGFGARPTLRSPEGPPSVSGGRHRLHSDR
jgi:hypothetical protein